MSAWVGVYVYMFGCVYVLVGFFIKQFNWKVNIANQGVIIKDDIYFFNQYDLSKWQIILFWI